MTPGALAPFATDLEVPRAGAPAEVSVRVRCVPSGSGADGAAVVRGTPSAGEARIAAAVGHVCAAAQLGAFPDPARAEGTLSFRVEVPAPGWVMGHLSLDGVGAGLWTALLAVLTAAHRRGQPVGSLQVRTLWGAVHPDPGLPTPPTVPPPFRLELDRDPDDLREPTFRIAFPQAVSAATEARFAAGFHAWCALVAAGGVPCRAEEDEPAPGWEADTGLLAPRVLVCTGYGLWVPPGGLVGALHLLSAASRASACPDLVTLE